MRSKGRPLTFQAPTPLQSNRITKMENLPESVRELYLSHNGIEKVCSVWIIHV